MRCSIPTTWIHRPPSALADERCFIRDVREWLAGREAEFRRGVG